MKKRWIAIAVIIIALLIVATIFIIPLVKDTKPNPAKVEDPIKEPIENTDKVEPSNVPTTTPTAPIEVPEEVQEVINNNQAEIYQDNAKLLATGYPSELIPLYAATTVAESQLITTANGNPGWLTSFVSEKSVAELAIFYRSLLSGLTNYSEEAISESIVFKATSGAYSLDLNLSPNIQEKTDLPGQSAASIYIEQVQ